VAVDESVPGDFVSIGHFVEQVLGIGEPVAFGVEIEEGGVDEEVGVEAKLEDATVRLLSC